MEVECVDQGDDQLQDASFINTSSSLSRSSSALVNFSSSSSTSAKSAASEESDQSIGFLEWIDPSKLEDSKWNYDLWKIDGLYLPLNLVFVVLDCDLFLSSLTLYAMHFFTHNSDKTPLSQDQ